MSSTSLILFYIGVGLLVVGLVLPGWDTNRLPKRAVRRRIYWTATAVAIPVLFIAGLPDLQSSLAFVAMAVILMGGWAYFRTPNIKIDGEIRSGYPPNREPDPLPRGDRG